LLDGIGLCVARRCIGGIDFGIWCGFALCEHTVWFGVVLTVTVVAAHSCVSTSLPDE
jgi:hypothetical protein